jgi:TolC family type I secretion outer membrane protein
MTKSARRWLSTSCLTALGFTIAVGLASPGPAGAQTFEDALALSYQSNPTLASERANLRATNEQIAQALSGYRPDVEITGDIGVDRSDADLATGGTVEETLNPASLGIQLVQPLYRGGRTAASVRRAENLIQAARASYLSVEQQVLLNAVIAYMNVVREQAVLDLTRNNEEVLQRQLRATRDRFEVGEVTRTDVSQAEASLSGAVANRINAEGALSAARATFVRVIGTTPGVLQSPNPMILLPASLDEAIALAESNNPVVVAQGFSELAAVAGVDVVRGELLPEVSLSGDVRRSYEPSATIDEVDSASIVAQVVVPLYQGGAVSSRVREARHQANAEAIQVAEARREAIEGAIQAWEGLSTARASIESLRSQVRAAQIALEGVRQESLVGSRTVLDVLDAEQSQLDARVNLVQAQRDEIVAAFQVLAAVGELTARDLDLPVDYYEFDLDYDAARRSWWGTGIEPIEVER